jgi:hypothetical protein
MAMIVATLYVTSLHGLGRLQRVDQHNRPIALFSWARMMMVLGFFVGVMLYLSLVHFILVTGVFVTTVWILLWWLIHKQHE